MWNSFLHKIEKHTVDQLERDSWNGQETEEVKAAEIKGARVVNEGDMWHYVAVQDNNLAPCIKWAPTATWKRPDWVTAAWQATYVHTEPASALSSSIVLISVSAGCVCGLSAASTRTATSTASWRAWRRWQRPKPSWI